MRSHRRAFAAIPTTAATMVLTFPDIHNSYYAVLRIVREEGLRIAQKKFLLADWCSPFHLELLVESMPIAPEMSPKECRSVKASTACVATFPAGNGAAGGSGRSIGVRVHGARIRCGR